MNPYGQNIFRPLSLPLGPELIASAELKVYEDVSPLDILPVDFSSQTKRIERDDMSKLPERSKAARVELECCIVDLLRLHPEGLRNPAIARALCLESDFMGRQKNYLTYSLLGGLIEQGRIDYCKSTYRFTLR